MNEKVVVHVRMRPINDDEQKKENSSPIYNSNLHNGISVFEPDKKLIQFKKGSDDKSLYFDSLIPKNSEQYEVFDTTAKPVVDVIIIVYIYLIIILLECTKWI